jgi:type IX secretion system PorP/SprF family membrane protein
MKKITTFFTLLLLTLSSIVVKSQDIHFSQVYETPLFLSPANTGFYNGYFRAIVNYRNQWASMGNAFQTTGISLDGGLFKSKKRPAFMGIGFTFFNDQAGAAKLRRTNAMLNISGLVKVGRYSAFSVGLTGGSSATNGNYADLIYASQFNGNILDPSIYSQELPYRQFTTVDVGVGGAYEFTKYKRDQDHDDVTSFKISYGAYHLNRAEQGFSAGSQYRMPVRQCVAITSLLDIVDTKFSITPTFVYQTQNKFSEIYLGSFVKYRMGSGTKVTGVKVQNAIGVGLFYRNKDAIVAKTCFDYGDYTISMAYDFNVSQYSVSSRGRGGFEISLRYNNLASSLFESRKEFK